MRGKETFAAALMVGMLALNGCQPSDAITPTVKTPIASRTALPTERLAKTNEQIIQEEVQRLGIQPNQNEANLWSIGYKRSSEIVPINDVTMQEAAARVNQTIQLMRQSENPYLRNAAAFIIPLLRSGEVRIGVVPSISASKQALSSTIALPETDNRLHWYVAVLAGQVLNDSVALSLSFLLAHEFKHVENGIKFQQSLPTSLSTQERYEKEQQRTADKTANIDEEARGYAEQARAFIYAYGQGFRGGKGTLDEESAAEFIKGGSKEDSIYWKDYIEKNIK